MQIVADVFPAHFSGAQSSAIPDVNDLNAISINVPNVAYVATTRVILTETHLSVASDSPDGPQLIFNEPYAQVLPPPDKERRTGTWRVITQSGKHIAFQKDDACGCGTRLRSWNPYRTLQSINDPTG
jgi:hypothetical protein